MSRVITETAKAFTDDTIAGLAFHIYLVEKDATYDTIVKRVRIQVSLPVDRSDGTTSIAHQIYAISDGASGPATFVAGDAAALRALLLKVYTSARTLLNLTE